ncbi:MAG: tRNA guanosine(34) transglycosylase Tgt [Candidatus Woesearchaeota archaeon]
MNFKIKKEFGNARISELRTRHSRVELPNFMPVATKAAAKYLSYYHLKELGVQAIICNSFLLYLKPGLNTIKEFGGIHKFMNFDKTIFTDCGGFQKLRPMFLESNNLGITFKSPFTGEKHFINPKKIIDVQYELGSDVLVSLDDCPHYKSSLQETKASMKKTHSWAVESLAEFKKINKDRRLLFGICQGGFFRKLRIESASFINSLDFDGVAIGGLRIGEPFEKTFEMLECSLKEISSEKPRYLMGVGNPADIVRAVRFGIDLFDSTYPVENARHGNIFTNDGKIDIEKAKFSNSKEPLDKNCDCSVCKKYSKAYIHHLFKTDEELGKFLAVYHNQHFMQELMRKIRKSVRDGNIRELEIEMIKKFKTK